jgi:dTDP-4-dehydrorhamnose reductase
VGPRGAWPARRLRPYHVVCEGGASWLDFARELRAALGAATAVEGIARAKLPQPAPRPPDSRLDGARLAQVFGVRLPTWQEALRRCLATEP